MNARNWLMENCNRKAGRMREDGVKEPGGQQENGKRTVCLCGRERVPDGEGEIKREMDRTAERKRL